MKKSDVYEIAIKLAGIYLFMTMIVSALTASSASIWFVMIRLLKLSSYQQYEQINSTPYIIIFVVIYFFLLNLSLILIFKTKYVTELICSKTDFEQDMSLSIDPKTIYEVALILFGLVSLAWVLLPELGYYLARYLVPEQLQTVSTPRSSHFPWVPVVRIIVSVIVIIKAKSLARYFTRKSDEINP